MTSRPMATVLSFDHEVLVSGRALPRPINYSLSRIVPPAGVVVDPRKRPVVVVDPRAGQGPGIGGFKTESEIGEALATGHPVYFIGFAAEPEPGQTFLDVVEGQVTFFERIRQMHPEAPPSFAIGNCQAGYQTLMVAMLRPDLFGPCMVAGSPMSYWQGVHGKNPMRYSGGLLGGSWLTNLISDLGGGKFDGTWLILNFDNLNPANWLWGKQYDVWSKVDTEGPRYLEFEKWWGDFIKLNGDEIQFLVDEFFIGDKLTRNEVRSTDGKVFDLRNISSPVIVFTSQGDNISPPPQTLGWILDLYRDVDDIRAEGRTIVYCMNQKVGHLAIFVSAKVGAKEDEELVRLMDLIDCLPPGLYELVIEPASEEQVKAGGPAWHSRFELRSLDDIRAYGRNSVEDDRAFAAARRVSEINHSLYRTFLQPFVKAVATPQLADALFRFNPLRLSYSLFADTNPLMKGVEKLAADVTTARKPADATNPFLTAQNFWSDQINAALDGWRDVRDRAVEQSFFALYGSPVLHGLLGLNLDEKVRELPANSPQKEAFRDRKIAEFRDRVAEGGFNEALVRASLYVLSVTRALDEAAASSLNETRQKLMQLSLPEFKTLVRDQFYILLLEREKAVEAIARLVTDSGQRQDLVNKVVGVATADGTYTPGERALVERLAEILGVSAPKNVALATVKTAPAPGPGQSLPAAV
jgi:tellurite resistance protein